MKKIGVDFRQVNVMFHLGASGVTQRDSSVLDHLALIRESRSKRVTVVKVKEESGYDGVPTFIWLDRVSPQVYTPEYENPEGNQIDLYLDEFDNVVQA